MPSKKKAEEAALDPAIERLIEEMGRYYESSGVPRIGGRIVALLIASDRPLSAEQISRSLHVARSSVSTNLALLQNRGAAEPITYPGDRLTYYRFSWETWQMTIKAQIVNFGRLKDIVQRAMTDLAAGNPSRERLREFTTWIDFFLVQYNKILENWPRTGMSKAGGAKDGGSLPSGGNPPLGRP